MEVVKPVLKDKTNQQQQNSKSLAYYNQRIEELQVSFFYQWLIQFLYYLRDCY
jgi:hypothetical protein